MSRAEKHRPRSSAVGLVLVAAALLTLGGFAVYYNARTHLEEGFADLARSFLHGSAELTGPSAEYDTAVVDGHAYWPLGPFPAVVLMPFVGIASLLGGVFHQGYLNVLFVFGAAFCVFRVATVLGYSKEDASYLVLAFFGGSMMIAVAMYPIYSYFAHTVTVGLLWASLLEFVTRRRPWVIGCLMACVLATRAPAFLGILLFALEPEPRNGGRKRAVALFAPIAVAALALALYNQARFGNPLEQGYSLQKLIPALEETRSRGLLSLSHVPANLYHMLVAGPSPVPLDGKSADLKFPWLRPNVWGLNIFFTSPYLVTLFFLRYRDRLSKLLLLTVALIAVPIVMYYGIGYRQFGYRYALDFMPFLFFLFARAYAQAHEARLSVGLKATILVSACVNAFLFFQPLLGY